MKKLLLVFTLLCVLLFAVPVFADSSRGSHPRIRVKDGTSTNWGGYAALTSFSNPVVNDVKGSWIIPQMDCSKTPNGAYSSAWIGIDGYNTNTVEQTGTEHDCVSGQPQYSVWYEMYPKFPVTLTLPIKAGDVFSAEVKYVGSNIFQLIITNNSQPGASFTTYQRSKGRRQSAEWIVEAPYSGGVLPLADFQTISFTGAQATMNKTGSISAFPYDPITMVIDASGSPKATVSPLTAGGDGFTMTWVHQ